ncbi:MAG: hypothetical protein ABI533_10695 [Betaproteobacteria bacterium]
MQWRECYTTRVRLGLAREGPRSIRVFDVDPARGSDLVERIGRIEPSIGATVGEPVTRGIDMMLNGSPVGMLDDPGIPIGVPGARVIVILSRQQDGSLSTDRVRWGRTGSCRRSGAVNQSR